MEKIAIIAFTEKGNHLAMRMDRLLPELEVHRFTTKKAAADESGTDEAADGEFVPDEASVNDSTADESGSGESEIVTKDSSARKRWELPPKSLQTGLQKWCGSMFSDMDGLVFIGAAGIAVRTIAPFLHSKVSDPAVLVSDELGIHLISLLSGHLGGGNELTRKLAARMGADPVITTASDVNGKLAVDVWAKKNKLYISSMKQAREVAAAIVAGKQLPFFCQGTVRGRLPEEFCLQEWKPENERQQSKVEETVSVSRNVHRSTVEKQELHGAELGSSDLNRTEEGLPGIMVSPYQREFSGLHLIPACVVLGIGCKKDKDYGTIRDQLEKVCRQYGLSIYSIGKMVSVDRKAQEPGLLKLAKTLDIPFETCSAEALNRLPGTFTGSAFVKETVGVDNVCERSAVMGLPEAEREDPVFVCRKYAEQGVTLAMTMKKWEVRFE